MRLNRSTLLNIVAMFLLGCVLWQAESFLGDYQIYIAKLIFINIILAFPEPDLRLHGPVFPGAGGLHRRGGLCLGAMHPAARAEAV